MTRSDMTLQVEPERYHSTHPSPTPCSTSKTGQPSPNLFKRDWKKTIRAKAYYYKKKGGGRDTNAASSDLEIAISANKKNRNCHSVTLAARCLLPGYEPETCFKASLSLADERLSNKLISLPVS